MSAARRAASRLAHGLIERLPPERRKPVRRRLRRLTRPAFLGTLRRTTPLGERWGSDRGEPVDRHYIERFLSEHRADITGRVLEVKEPLYTERYGSGVVSSDVLDIDAGNPRATIVADLAAAHGIPDEAFDCFVLTQTLQLIPELPAALEHAHRLLKPGGVVLATVPCLSPLVGTEAEAIDYWRFTAASCRYLFEAAFGAGAVEVHAYGNVLASIAFLSGMAADELRPHELEALDERVPLLVAVRAVRH